MEKDKKGFYLSKLEEFRNGKYRNQKQHRTLITMGRRIQGEKEEKNIVDLLDNYVFTTKGDKTLPRMLVLDFYEFLGEDLGQSQWIDQIPIDNPLRRQLEIAKYLHEPHSVREIAESFGFSEDTVRSDLHALVDGIEFMGSSIQVHEIGDRLNRSYSSTLHPVFLPLNMSEVILMTSTLLEIKKNSPLFNSYARMVGRIYGQLSDYGKSMVKKKLPEEMVLRLEKEDNIFRDEQDALHSGELDDRIMFAHKRGEVKSIQFVMDEATEPVEIENAGIQLKDGFIHIISEAREEYIVRKEQIRSIENVDYE